MKKYFKILVFIFPIFYFSFSYAQISSTEQINEIINKEVDTAFENGTVKVDFSEVEKALKPYVDSIWLESRRKNFMKNELAEITESIKNAWIETFKTLISPLLKKPVQIKAIKDILDGEIIIKYYQQFYKTDVKDFKILILNVAFPGRSENKDLVTQAKMLCMGPQKSYSYINYNKYGIEKKIEVPIIDIYGSYDNIIEKIFNTKNILAISPTIFSLPTVWRQSVIIHEVRHLLDLSQNPEIFRNIVDEVESLKKQALPLVQQAFINFKNSPYYKEHYQAAKKMFKREKIVASEKDIEEYLEFRMFIPDFIDNFSYMYSQVEKRAFEEQIKFLKHKYFGSMSKNAMILEYQKTMHAWHGEDHVPFPPIFYEEIYDSQN